MTSTRTSTSTHTRTQTSTFLSELVMGTIGDILAELGIDLTRLYRDWGQDQDAIKAWIEEGSLAMVILECHRPDGAVKPIFEFPINYEQGGEANTASSSPAPLSPATEQRSTRFPRGRHTSSTAHTISPPPNKRAGAPATAAPPPGSARSASARSEALRTVGSAFATCAEHVFAN
jgi:hypothetical protein